MLPYLIAGAIGYGIAKLFEDDKAPKYVDGGSVLLAPNGKPSNLTPEQYKLVREPAFKKWFGDWENDPENASKVVDKNGEPLVVYHGTNAEFYKFNKSKGKGKIKQNSINFSSKKEVAKDYGSKILECFLNIRNPYTKNYNSESYHNIEFNARYENKFDEIPDQIVNKTFDEKIYDGVIFLNIKDSKSRYSQNVPVANNYYAFNNNQIKLANGRNTTFDGNNPDIRFDDGGNINDDDIRVFEELYHGTSKKRSDEIKRNGFSLRNQGEKSGLGSVNGISLTSDFDIAQEHSDWASEKFNDEGSVLTIKSETLKILSGSKFASLNSDFEKAFELYEKGLIDGIELCDYKTGDGCEEFEVFIFNTNKLNNLIIK